MTEPISRRAQQAQQTRVDIIDAARRLLTERGYRATSMKAVADAVGVSVQTVYDSVGSKSALVLALVDVVDADAGVAEIVGDALGTATVEAIVGLPARIQRSIMERAGDIIRIAVGAASSEPALQKMLEEGRARHVAGTIAMAQWLEGHGALRDGITVAEASETAAALADTSFAVRLHDAYGWSLERIETWTTAAIKRLIVES